MFLKKKKIITSYNTFQVNLVFIMIKQDRVTGEFQKLISDSLAMFQKSAVPVLRLLITHCAQGTRGHYLSTFFKDPFILKTINEWNLKRENFIFVDLDLENSDFKGKNEDVAIMCQALMESTIPLHKTEVFSQFADEGFQKAYGAVSNPLSAMFKGFFGKNN